MEQAESTVTAVTVSGGTSHDARLSQRGRKVPQRTLRERTYSLLENFGLLVVFGVAFAYFAVSPRTGHIFLSSANVNTVLANQAVAGLVALAMVLPLIAGYFDLSIAATTGIVSLFVAATIGYHHWPIGLSLAVGVAVGMLVGLLVGLLVAVVRLNAFITTFGVYVLLLGLSEWYTGGSQISNLPPSLGDWGSASWMGIPRPFWVLVIVSATLWFVLSQTTFGRYLTSIGSNEHAAKLVGIDTNRMILASFVGAGLIAGIAGALLTARLGGANASSGGSFLFPAFAAIFLGATVISAGKYNVWGTIIAVYFVGFVVSGLILLGASSWVYDVFDGAALILAVCLSTMSGRAKLRRITRHT